MISGRLSLPNGTNAMHDTLKIECGDWLGPATSVRDIFQVTRAPIGIRVGEEWLTRLEDSWGNTVRNRLNASAATLARWFAGNWWRLRWEPEVPNSRSAVDWRLSHSVASAGDGYCWPTIVFVSDGESVEVASWMTQGQIMGPVRYLSQITTRVAASDFEKAIDGFLTLVLARLEGEGYRGSELSELWGEVNRERRDPALTRWRKLEALCGYDPDEAPDEAMKRLVNESSRLGSQAMDEVAAYGRHDFSGVLDQIEVLAADKRPGRAGIHAKLPTPNVSWKRLGKGERPWRRGVAIARKVRQDWGLGTGPISDRHLAEILGTGATGFSRATEVRTKIPVGLRRGDSSTVDLYFHTLRRTGQRFAAGRLIGDHCCFDSDERLIPETDAKTARQQFQRAFAQEFLCPFDAMKDAIQTDRPDEEDIDQVAEHFGVSPLLVKTTLVNNGELDRQALQLVNGSAVS
jgi:hypothetical protein